MATAVLSQASSSNKGWAGMCSVGDPNGCSCDSTFFVPSLCCRRFRFFSSGEFRSTRSHCACNNTRRQADELGSSQTCWRAQPQLIKLIKGKHGRAVRRQKA